MTLNFKNLISSRNIHSYNIVQFASIAAFVISATFTILLMISSCYSTLSIIFTIGMGIILEFAKSYFFTRSLISKNYTIFMRLILLIVATLLFAYSIIASLSFLANENAKNTQPEKIADEKVASHSESIKLKETLISNKKTALEEYKKTSQQEIDNLKESLKNIPKDYFDYSSGKGYYETARDETDKINKLDTARTAEINNRNTEINTLYTELGKLKSESTVNTASKTGYNAFVDLIVRELNKNKKSNLWTHDQAMAILLGGLSILFEVTAVLLYYSASVEKKAFLQSTKTAYTRAEDKKDSLNQQLFAKDNLENPARSKALDNFKINPIGFMHNTGISNNYTVDPVKADTNDTIENTEFETTLQLPTRVTENITKEQEVTKEQIRKYLDFIQENLSPKGICPSNAAAVDETGFTKEKIRAIKNILRTMGIIDEQKRRTVLLRAASLDDIYNNKNDSHDNNFGR